MPETSEALQPQTSRLRFKIVLTLKMRNSAVDERELSGTVELDQ